MTPHVSVLILSLNEEINIQACLDSVKWSDDIVVFDSFSQDRTVEIAKANGARVVQRTLDNWSAHHNWALDNIKFKHPWTFHIDCDERCDPVLAKEMEALDENDGHSAFRVRRKDYFMGKWIRHAQLYPTWITRVFRPGKVRYSRLVNPVVEVDGLTGELWGHFEHHPFSHGLDHWFARHNRYSDMEAAEIVSGARRKLDLPGIFSRDGTRRRIAIKELGYALPCRPVWMFLYLMVVRRALLDGPAGYHYAILRAIYEFMIDIKVREIRTLAKNPEI
jgi:glycosyltransferase involved in cell wall biosynthesis